MPVEEEARDFAKLFQKENSYKKDSDSPCNLKDKQSIMTTQEKNYLPPHT